MARIKGTQGYWDVYVDVTETSTSVENNTSTASWTLGIKRNTGSSYMAGTPTINLWISGQHVLDNHSQYFNLPSVTTGDLTLLSGTVSNIAHNSDGTISSNAVSFSWRGSGFSPNSIDGSGSYSTSTIPRASTITATSTYIGEVSQITVSRKSSSFKHSIRYSFKGETKYIKSDGTTTSTETKITDTSIGFTTPMSWYSLIPNDSEETCTLYIKTYSGSTQIGSTQSTTFKARVDLEASKPNLSVSVTDINPETIALTGNNKRLVSNWSMASVSWSASAKSGYGATLSKVTIIGQEVTESPYQFQMDNRTSIICQAIDSRNNAVTKSPTFTLVPYFFPNITSQGWRVEPTSSYMEIEFGGEFFNENFGVVDNEINISWKYKEANATEWIDGGTFVKDEDYTIDGNNYYSGTYDTRSPITIGGDMTYDKGWDIGIFVNDLLCTIPTSVINITKGIPIINWDDDSFNVNGDIKQKNVNIFDIIDKLGAYGQYCLDSRYTVSQSSWSNPELKFSSYGTFNTNNSQYFAKSGNGIKCKFSGRVLIIGGLGNDYDGETDLNLVNGSTTYTALLNVGGHNSYNFAVADVNENDVIKIKINCGAGNFTVYSGKLVVVRLSI